MVDRLAADKNKKSLTGCDSSLNIGQYLLNSLGVLLILVPFDFLRDNIYLA